MLENTIQTCYPSGGYSVNNPICNKLTIYEGSTLNYILLNNEYYEISNDEVLIAVSNDNVILENNRKIVGNKSGIVMIEYTINLGFIKKTFSVEVEILPFAMISLRFTSFPAHFLPYEDVSNDFYNDDVKKDLLNKFQNEIPNIFFEKTGYEAEVIDVYRLRKNEFYPILKTEFKYNSLKIMINGQTPENDIILKIGERINVEYFISDSKKAGDCDMYHSIISGDDIFNNRIAIKKSIAKRVVIIEYNVIVK